MQTASPPAITHTGIARQAWPIILANASVPLLGLVDTAVIGHYGSTAGLGALALGALLFNFIYWSFGFLRMATTGFIAQADGAGDEAEVRATLARSLLRGAGLGVCLVLAQWPLAVGWFAAMDASDLVAAGARTSGRGSGGAGTGAVRLQRRVGQAGAWPHPAAGAMLLQANAVLDVYFAGVLGMGARRIGWAAIAEWSTCAVAAWVLWRMLRERHDSAAFVPWARLRNAAQLRPG